MLRSIGLTFMLFAGSAAAEQPMDCFNDEQDSTERYTSVEPEVLRITDADIANLLARLRAQESRSVADAGQDSATRM